MISSINKYLLALMVMFLVFTPETSAITANYDCFHHLRLWSDEIKAIYPDSSGRIWVGTIHGLMRYGDFPIDSDSYDYYPAEFKSGVNSIQYFDGNQMLIRIQDGGRYVLYSPRTNAVSYELDTLLIEWGINLKNQWQLNIQSDGNGNLWFYSDGKLYVRLMSSNKTVKIVDLPDRIYNLSVNDKYFCFTTEGIIWVYSINGLKPKRKITDILHGNARVIKIGREGNIWIGGDNLLRYDLKNCKLKTIRDNIIITDLVLSRNGDVLVSTNSSGILRYDNSGNLLQEIHHVPYDPTSLASDNIRYITEDADTTLWICYDKRVISACNPRTPASSLKHIYNIKTMGFDDDIISIRQDPQGYVWMGSNGNGLFQMSPDGEFFSSGIWDKFKSAVVTDFFFDSHQRTWIATYRDGIYCMDGNELRHFMPNSSVYSTVEDANGNIWLGILGKGVYLIRRDLVSSPEHIDTRHNNWILKLIVKDEKTIYGASSNGIFSIDTQSYKYNIISGNKAGTQNFKNHNFQSIFKDSRNLYWLIGQQFDTPLEIYDALNDTIFEIPKLKGQIIKSITEDNSNNVWIASEQDIVHVIVNYDTANNRYIFIPSFYQFRSSGDDNMRYYNYRAAEKLNDGRILFGSSDGYRIIDPKNFPPHVSHIYAPDLYIASIKVNEDYIKVGNKLNGRDIINEDLATLRSIRLDHDENNLIVTIGNHDLTSTYQTDIYYQLKGRDSEWRKVRANVIELTDLPPGKYKLEICSEKADGNMSDNILSLDISINSPWYASIWAWIIYILLIVGLLVMSIYHFLDRQKQKMYVAQIKKEADRQYQLNEMKLRFFTNISHDFRTPLSLIITPLETYLSDEANKSSEKYLRPVYKNAVRLLNLINQILDFRKIDVNGAALNLSYGDIVSFLKEICSSFTLFAEDTGKSIHFETTQSIVNMYFDKDKLSKIMMNLLSNSFKFTKDGSIVIVSFKTDGDYAVINVSDNGPGIPDNQKTKIFERFYQTDSPSSEYIGSGIGLHIVKEFVTLHKGSISVFDNNPSGAIFSVRLPIINHIPKEETKIVNNESENEDVEIVTDKNINLLLVEDNADFREFMKTQLSDEYKVFTAVNGEDALKILEKQEVRIIISDIMMDGMDGLELCRKVKNDLTISHIPIILLTAKALAEDEILGLECGADDYITKPFNMSVLRRRIKKIIDDSLKSQKKFKDEFDVKPSEITITSLDEQFLSNSIKCVEDNMSGSDFSVEAMSSILGIHRTQLYKKLVSLTGKTPVEFIRLIRLKRAAQYLIKSQMFISEIAYLVGFNSPKLFTKHFKEEFGMSPRDYQKKFSENPIHPDDNNI